MTRFGSFVTALCFILLQILMIKYINCFARFSLRREGIVIENSIVDTELTLPELLACAAACSNMTDCVTISYHSGEKRCLLSLREMSHYSFPRLMIAESGWITMSNARYLVYQRKGPNGHYSVLEKDAASVCENENTTMASEEDLLKARALGLDVCTCAWLKDKKSGFVRQKADLSCWGSFNTGLISCGYATTSKFNVWCHFQ